ncbi:MAG: hypothetical protein GY711_16290 [bacterium]|nr:hypothetical protein [bacterium]
MLPPIALVALATPQDTFAARVAVALTAQDAAAVDALVDRDALVARITSDLNLSRMVLAQYEAETLPDLSLGAELCAALPKGARVDVVGSAKADEEERPLLRVASEDELEYVTLIVVGDKLVDAIVARQGQSIATGARRDLCVQFARDKAGIIKKLPEPEKSFVRSASTFETIDNRRARGESEAALAEYRTLPAILRAEPAGHFLALAIAGEIGAAARDAQIGSSVGMFPGDLGVLLHVLDIARGGDDDKQVLAAIRQLEDQVQPDAMLVCMRGHVHANRKDARAAKIAFNKALKLEPAFAPAHWGIIHVSLERKDFRALPKLLLALEKECAVELDDLDKRSEFADFVASRYYASWQKRRQ